VGEGFGRRPGQHKRAGFATLYQEKLLALEKVYKGIAHEDDMVRCFRSAPLTVTRPPHRSIRRCMAFCPSSM